MDEHSPANVADTLFRVRAKHPHNDGVPEAGERPMTRVREWITTAREERWGMLTDLAFAVVWVTVVELVTYLLSPPTWVYYTLMLAGIVAYFGFVWNFELAISQQHR
ncbi:hypothetical protein C486_20529 [Natrinema gari JCM 14663]|uniref:DUF8119 domain-containing protein n=2 Tax=Natrinema gari TaxID=419186 RepID=L9YM02_9EURY|nr:hypothetical protein C486_20529 [Natrinema gari JCM 14663]